MRIHFLKKYHVKQEKTSIRQASLLNNLPDIVMEVDMNKVYTWANQAGIEFFGKNVIGKEASHYFEGEQDTYEKVDVLFEGSVEKCYVESWQRRKDGQKRLLAWHCMAMKDRNGELWFGLKNAVIHYDGVQFKTYSQEDGLRGKSAMSSPSCFPAPAKIRR